MRSLTRSAARSIAAAACIPFALARVDPAECPIVTEHRTAPPGSSLFRTTWASRTCEYRARTEKMRYSA
jgi:hypothetical protein